MTPIPSDDQLRHAYRADEADHDRLRGELLAKLPECVIPAASPTLRRPRGLWMALAISACFVVAVGLWMILGELGTQPVYAVDGLRERLLDLHSLHLKGWLFYVYEMDGKETVLKLPIERFAEKSARMFGRGHGISNDGKNVTVRTSYSASDRSRTLMVNETDKQWMSWETPDPISVELEVEWTLQNQLAQELIHGLASDYRAVGREKVGKRETLKYESVRNEGGERMLHRIWLDVTTGLPVQCASLRVKADGQEQPQLLYDVIAINAPAPADMFSFVPPAGYAGQAVAPRSDDPFANGSGGAGKDRAAVRHAFAIDRLAVLCCWQHRVEGDDSGTEVIPNLELQGAAGNRECVLRPLRTQKEGKQVWHLALAVPRDRRPLDSSEHLHIEFRLPSGSRMSFAPYPLRFGDERLAKFIARLQEPGVSEQEPLTLARLRWQAARLLTSDGEQPIPETGR